MEYIVFTRTFLPYVNVIMVFMRVFLVERLFQIVMGWVTTLSVCCQVHMGSYGRVLSHQAISAITSRCSSTGSAYPVTKAPMWVDWTPGSSLGQ
jgi:glucan phosphoethanolaminetransferase (alkaline phosphatase superfamily)